MKKHNRQGQPRTEQQPWTCIQCRNGNCEGCVDVLRAVIPHAEPICKCETPGHDGEPVDQQVRDPFTDSVHGPGMEVTVDGETIRTAPKLDG